LLVLGIWWRGLTAPGALAGMAGGGLSALLGTVVAISIRPDGWLGALVGQPAMWSVPVGFGLMVGVSLLTRDRVPSTVARTMVRLHTPERVDVQR
jgi:Na+(H+)/acetate symporter ActP